MAYKDIIGHQEIISFLRNVIQFNRIAHAYLFYGPEGVGKEFCAMQFATALLCEKPVDSESCGKCSSCVRVQHQTHPNLIRVAQKETDTFLKIDTIREVRKDIGLKAFEGNRRIYLIPEADRMMPQAANALLKTLEEPGENVIFILIATDLTTILPTIISRCQPVRFYRLSQELIKSQLMHRFQVADSDAELSALLAEGSLGRAFHLVEGEFLTARNQVVEIISGFCGAKPIRVFRTAEELLELELDFAELTDLLTLWFRDILVYQRTGEKSRGILMNPDKEPAVSKSATRWSVERIEQAINQLAEIKLLYRKLGGTRYGFGSWYSGMNQQLALESVLLPLSK
ncbi:MAG: DNA polymerase III subunit delta' [bacterium]|nr:DNA polymerase III subunit delta' [bacterium]